MKKIITLFSFICMCGLSAWAQADEAVQLFIANGGFFESTMPTDYVTIGTFKEGNYTVFDTIQNQSVQDALVKDNFLYIASEDSIVKYDADTYERVATTDFGGDESFGSVHSIRIGGEYLFATKWYGENNQFLKVYNANTLELVQSTVEGIDSVPGGMAVNPAGFLYISQKNEEGIEVVEVMDLNTLSITETLNIENESGSIKSLFYQDGLLYGINYTNSMLLKFDLETEETTSFDLSDLALEGFGSGFSSHARLVKNKIYMLANSGVATFDLETNEIEQLGSITTDETVVALEVDTVNLNYFINTTDYFSSGICHPFTGENDAAPSFNIGVSAEAMAMHYKSTISSTEHNIASNTNVELYPNPVENNLIIASDEIIQSIEIFDLSGKRIYQKINLNTTKFDCNLGSFNADVYLVKIQTKDKQNIVQKIVKQ